jgi:hypothetical protein
MAQQADIEASMRRSRIEAKIAAERVARESALRRSRMEAEVEMSKLATL